MYFADGAAKKNQAPPSSGQPACRQFEEQQLAITLYADGASEDQGREDQGRWADIVDCDESIIEEQWNRSPTAFGQSDEQTLAISLYRHEEVADEIGMYSTQIVYGKFAEQQVPMYFPEEAADNQSTAAQSQQELSDLSDMSPKNFEGAEIVEHHDCFGLQPYAPQEQFFCQEPVALCQNYSSVAKQQEWYGHPYVGHTPVPMQALQSRLQSNTKPPTWAAWLPKPLQQPYLGGIAETSMSNISYQDVPTMMDDSTFPSHDAPDAASSEPVMWVPMLVPVEEFENWQETNNYTWYMPPEQEYAEMEENSQQVQGLLASVSGKVLKMARDIQGTRLVQQAFLEAQFDEERLALASEIKGHVWDLLKCLHGNHVLQKCIETLPPQDVQFVIDEISQPGRGGAAQAARHRFGCRAMERVLEHCSAEQVAPLVGQLLADSVALSSHEFGHFVMVHLLQHCPDVVSPIASTLHQQLSAGNSAIPTDGYIGAVMSEVLKHSENRDCCSLATVLIEDSERLASMALCRWGHPAIKRALQIADDSSRLRACKEVLRCSEQYRSNRYGRIVKNFVTEQQSLECIAAH
jgi:hypothetical protein